MGSSQSTETVASTSSGSGTAAGRACPIDPVKAKEAGCPVDHTSNTAQSPTGYYAPAEHPSLKGLSEKEKLKVLAKEAFNLSDPQSYPSECPMNGAAAAGSDSGQKLNPRNMMPAPNQLPAPDQPFTLPTVRVKSSIPKSGAEEGETWLYPSQQMFWNAMLRKGWRWREDDIKQKDMDDIIKIHNFNNEKAWQEILVWEKFRDPLNSGTIKLKSFKGDSKRYTPRASFRHWILGYELPFDRHDWMVERNGEEVHYVIDYYDGGELDSKTGDFALLDVRPALDSPGNAWHRMLVGYARIKMKYFGWKPAAVQQQQQQQQAQSE